MEAVRNHVTNDNCDPCLLPRHPHIPPSLPLSSSHFHLLSPPGSVRLLSQQEPGKSFISTQRGEGTPAVLQVRQY